MTGSPEDLADDFGLDSDRLARVDSLLETWTSTGVIPAASYILGRHGRVIAPRFFGHVDGQNLFLSASITKPLTVLAAMMLVERGSLTLDDRVADILPTFAQAGKGEVRIRHLMTHTSGLPDMLPENDALRAEHATTEEFQAAIDATPLRFVPGTQVRYQSMGTATLGSIVRAVSGTTLPSFLTSEVFGPLGMHDTWLGTPLAEQSRVAPVRISPEQAATDWHWNSAYWLGFGAPWGGLTTTASDYGKLCRLMLDQGRVGATRLIAPATVGAMTRNQIAPMVTIPELDRQHRPWGLGWRLSWPGSSAFFGDLLGPRAYGHWGATGTLCWIDPDADAFAVVLTTLPPGDQGTHLARISNALAACLT
ncbi:serine hydrolase domain-containing protein [Isosphaeraceae bacterium EP7]